jgi:hypothetical protein
VSERLQHSIAYYLIDTIADPVKRQRVAAQRFGKAIAKLTLDSTPQASPAATGDTTPTSRAGDKRTVLVSVADIPEIIALVQGLKDERDYLAALLDGVMQDDPQAIRDAAAWLAANRPEVDG